MVVRILDFIFAARPMLHLPIWSIFLVSYHYRHGDFSASALIVLIGLTLIGSGTYYLNQVYDYESDLLNRKLGFLQKGLLEKRQLLIAGITLSIVAPIIGAVQSLVTLAVFVPLIAGSIAYSLPPFRVKDRPLAGLLVNAVGYGVLIPMTVPGMLTRLDRLDGLLAGYFFLTVAATYLLTVIPDRAGDEKAGKRTYATMLTDRTIIITALALLAGSILVSLLLLHHLLVPISTIGFGLCLFALISKQPSHVLLACKVPILLLSLLAGYYYPGYFIFLVVLLVATRIYYRRRFGIPYPRLN
ncbi:MAG: UbiA family prenyltransferase [candidate division Zixibacteria bacterium]|nr:UbiA family prenyltransferase [candidate division Zixibacteria bacterium]